jgi:hypothetical protein
MSGQSDSLSHEGNNLFEINEKSTLVFVDPGPVTMMLLASTELWYHGQDKQTVPLPAPTHYHNALEQARRWYDVQDKEIGTHPPDIKFPAFVAIVHVTDNLV